MTSFLSTLGLCFWIVFISLRVRRNMADINDVKNEVAAVKSAVAAEIAAVNAKIAALQAAGGPTPAQLDEVVADLKGIETSLNTETGSVS